MPEIEQPTIDFRIYIGMILFRWKIIVICFLYALLGGVLYLDLAPKKYESTCKIIVQTESGSGSSAEQSRILWESSLPAHKFFLEGGGLSKKTAGLLYDKWGKIMGNQANMMPKVTAEADRKLRRALDIKVLSRNREYSRVFLTLMMEEHQKGWTILQRTAANMAAQMLKEEMNQLGNDISGTEDELIEYQRLHDIARVEARGSMESRFLDALMTRLMELRTELMLLEATAPKLESASVGVISDISKLTRETGAIEPAPIQVETKSSGKYDEGLRGVIDDLREEQREAPKIPDLFGGDGSGKSETGDIWRNKAATLARLEQKEKELAANLRPEHPELKSVREEIKKIKDELEISAQIELGRLKDRQKALKTHIEAIETAEKSWQSKNLLASQKRAELTRISGKLQRLESNYNTLFSDLHQMMVTEELKAQHFYMMEGIDAPSDPVWPDPLQIMIIVLMVGLGSGFGIAILAHVFDNSIQTIKDVELGMGIPFLGGVPYWAHSGLEKSIRPIVTEEHSTGAIEAYRALRTSVLTALDKLNEKIVIVTSADSGEGKTLTVLNLAIMTAQMGKKVLLVDMDLRRGRLHKSLGLEREAGLTDVLRKEKKLGEVIEPTKIDNLSFVSSGGSVDDTAELLQASDLVGIFAEARDEYDYIFIDTSPILRVTDTVIVATQGLGSVVYVAHVSQTPKSLIKYSLDMLKDIRVLGIVMNNIELHKFGSLYYTYQYPNYAYYSNAYAYGYDSYYYDDKEGVRKPRKHRSAWSSRRHAVEKWFRRTFLP